MKKLKFHEKKLLKKVNFLEWKKEGVRERTSICNATMLLDGTITKSIIYIK